jgi:hypothetical protein
VKLTWMGAVAVGYVLGAKAGRDRYEQIRQLASEAAERLEAYGSGGTLATRLEQGHSPSDAVAGRG